MDKKFSQMTPKEYAQAMARATAALGAEHVAELRAALDGLPETDDGNDKRPGQVSEDAVLRASAWFESGGRSDAIPRQHAGVNPATGLFEIPIITPTEARRRASMPRGGRS